MTRIATDLGAPADLPAPHDEAAGATVFTPSAAPPEPSLKQRTITSSLWTMGGHGLNQGLRFCSNILLAWLMSRKLGDQASAVFGVMALVATFMQGLEMFSDLGIGPSIIHSKRGEDPRFLNTAWTVGIIRGFALWGCACLLAYPASLLWHDQLLYLLPVAGIQAAIVGFQSTAVTTLNRRLNLKPIMLMRVGQQVSAITVMAVWAYISPSVWALVAGNLTSVTFKAVVSHFLRSDIQHRLMWDREAARELFTFGRWIFISTVITFFAAQSDKLLLEPLMGKDGARILGLYYMAQLYATFVPILSRQIASQVGFPALAELNRRDPGRFKSRLRHLRLVLLGITETGLVGMIMVGPVFVKLVYPQEFRGIEWMLVPLAVGSMGGMVNTTYGTAFMAMGRTFYVLTTVIGQLILVLACSLGGFYVATRMGHPPEAGFVIGMGLVQWLLYPLTIVLTRKLGIFDPKVDVPILLSTGAIGIAAMLYWM